MNEFMLGVVSSLAATALTVGASWVLSARARGWATRLMSRYTGLGVRRLYPTQRAAAAGLTADLARARWVAVLAGRGNELTREPFAPLWEGTAGRPESVRIALPDPDGRWLARRAESVGRTDRALRPTLLRDQVRTNLGYVTEVSRHLPALQTRIFEAPNLYRIVLTDKVAYITLYEDTRHSRLSPCLAAHHPGFLYTFALHAFTSTWETAAPAP